MIDDRKSSVQLTFDAAHLTSVDVRATILANRLPNVTKHT